MSAISIFKSFSNLGIQYFIFQNNYTNTLVICKETLNFSNSKIVSRIFVRESIKKSWPKKEEIFEYACFLTFTGLQAGISQVICLVK